MATILEILSAGSRRKQVHRLRRIGILVVASNVFVLLIAIATMWSHVSGDPADGQTVALADEIENTADSAAASDSTESPAADVMPNAGVADGETATQTVDVAPVDNASTSDVESSNTGAADSNQTELAATNDKVRPQDVLAGPDAIGSETNIATIEDQGDDTDNKTAQVGTIPNSVGIDPADDDSKLSVSVPPVDLTPLRRAPLVVHRGFIELLKHFPEQQIETPAISTTTDPTQLAMSGGGSEEVEDQPELTSATGSEEPNDSEIVTNLAEDNQPDKTADDTSELANDQAVASTSESVTEDLVSDDPADRVSGELDSKPLSVAIVNPVSTRGDVLFMLNGSIVSLAPGESHQVENTDPVFVQFHRGEQHGYGEYALARGVYSFRITADGWDLIRLAEEAAEPSTVQ